MCLFYLCDIVANTQGFLFPIVEVNIFQYHAGDVIDVGVSVVNLNSCSVSRELPDIK